ncbi:MAG: hypothetical protein PHG96_01740 [Kiritimatiellae bacterium]|nr:hypothetical protein [Kiritimatiellia bacterium]
MPDCAPVLLLAFNRPESSKRVIEAIRPFKPAQVFFAVDGPRKNIETDKPRCEQTRQLVHSIDWPCEVHTLFRTENLGCRHAPPEAISWFFEHVDAGIILEDDCLPSNDFLVFASELLIKYAENHAVAMICGNNHYGYQTNRAKSYHFSIHANVWGWATWRRAWLNYDVDLKPYQTELKTAKSMVGYTARYRDFWWRYVDAMLHGMDTWATQWTLILLMTKKLVIRPKYNLVSNIGFHADSTHTACSWDAKLYERTEPLSFPLVHPDIIAPDKQADIRYEKRFTSYWFRGLTFLLSEWFKIKNRFNSF